MNCNNLKFPMHRSLKLAAVTTIACVGFNAIGLAPAQAQSGAMPKPAEPAVAEPATTEKAAATALVGQCRAVNKQTPLYKDRNTTSEAVTLLKINEKVTLAENAGSSGLISVSAPAKGFVLMANLKTCPGQPKPPTTPTGSCRVVVQKQGLAIRKEPGAGEVVGGVALNEKVTLVAPAEMKTATDGRDWVKIIKPVEGWVSEGFKDQAFKNLAACK
jgi:hypothetical protein